MNALLVALVLMQPSPPTPAPSTALVQQGASRDGGVAWPVEIGAFPLPTGAATAARQDTGNASLSSLDTKTPSLVSGRQPVDPSGVTSPISAAALPLPSGASTEATLALIKAKTDNLDVALSTRTKPADSQHVTVDSAPTTAVTGTFYQATQPVSLATAPTTPVTGTFWQATQPVSGTVTASGPLTDTQLRASAVPVSGTFYQATQPVSLATAPTTPVTGTFWQTTQPVSGTVAVSSVGGTTAVSGPLTDTQLRATPVPISGTVTANAGSGTMAVSLAVAPTTPVTGTFYQATQPVSIASMPSTPVTGAFFQATQPISAATLPLPSGAATDATLSQLFDGGVAVLGRSPAGQIVPIAIDSTGVMFVASPRPPPLNPFLPRCNPVRRTGCQP